MSELGDGFNAWQVAEWVHPLTCSGCGGPGDHQTDLVLLDDSGDGITIYCPECLFMQDVATGSPLGHMLAAGPPANPLARIPRGPDHA